MIYKVPHSKYSITVTENRLTGGIQNVQWTCGGLNDKCPHGLTFKHLEEYETFRRWNLSGRNITEGRLWGSPHSLPAFPSSSPPSLLPVSISYVISKLSVSLSHHASLSIWTLALWYCKPKINSSLGCFGLWFFFSCNNNNNKNITNRANTVTNTEILFVKWKETIFWKLGKEHKIHWILSKDTSTIIEWKWGQNTTSQHPKKWQNCWDQEHQLLREVGKTFLHVFMWKCHCTQQFCSAWWSQNIRTLTLNPDVTPKKSWL